MPVHYWGDIDTHGLAILDQLRGFVPHAASLMINHETLHEHSIFWGTEEKPTRRDLPRLTDLEQALYDDLRDNRIRAHLRLEQERIRFMSTPTPVWRRSFARAGLLHRYQVRSTHGSYARSQVMGRSLGRSRFSESCALRCPDAVRITRRPRQRRCRRG